MNSTFNITLLNLGSFFSFPSRFIARIRKFDDFLNHDLDAPSESTLTAFAGHPMTAASTANGVRMHTTRPPPARESLTYELISMPGPLAFLTSGYAVGLVAMALLLNRIQHIVVPPRRSFVYRAMRSRRSLFHAFFYSFFPINLSSTACRLTFRIPSLFFLFKSLALLTVIFLQISGYFPSSNNERLQAIGQWASQKDMADVCWSTFGAVCLALVTGALTRGLEGLNTANTSPFNLFGYAMLLHIYSVPYTHANKGPPSRPDKNVALTILLPLLQLTMIHFLGVKKRWSRYRLVPTSICSLITLVHFNFVLLTKPSSYPLLNYLPCLLETVLLLVTLLACVLNALTQLLLEGEIRRPLFGHTRSLQPKWDEDFAVVLLRLGTASLEATNVAGLGNEVGPISIGGSHNSALEKQGARKAANPVDEGIVELASGGVLSISPAKAKRGSKARAVGGFFNEIKNVKVQSSETDWLVDHMWLRELVRFGMTLLAAANGLFRFTLWLVWYRWRRVSRGHGSPEEDLKTDALDFGGMMRAGTPGAGDEDDNAYRRFLRGEVVSDDDDDYVPGYDIDHVGSESFSDTSALPSDAEGGDASDAETVSEDADVTNGKETAGLYSDLLTTSAVQSSYQAPIFIAHMTAASSSPLTRRRYGQLMTDPRRHGDASSGSEYAYDRKDEWVDFVYERRSGKEDIARSSARTQSPDTDDALDGRRNCVICTTEPRDIICWPCRCLALCDDCRENLASRFPASKHSCPCCRRSVEGFSRIYIP